jgi:membrane protein
MFQKWKSDFLNSGLVTSSLSYAERVKVPGSDGQSVLNVARFFVKGLSDGALALRASAISFQIIMAFFPTIILLFSLIPYISADFQDLLLQYIFQVIPSEASSLFGDAIVDLVVNKRQGVLSITFILVFYYASRSVSAILAAFSESVNLVNKRHPFKQFLVSLLIMLVFAILVITALSLVTISDWLDSYLSDHKIIEFQFQRVFFYILNYLIIFILFMMAISLLYNVGNVDAKGWTVFSAGTIVTSVLMILLSFGFAYFVTNYASYDQLYGYVGSIIIFCLWIYFNSMMLLIGFELNASISKGILSLKLKEESLVVED